MLGIELLTLLLSRELVFGKRMGGKARMRLGMLVESNRIESN